jgi:hypothetical protein
MLLMVMWCNLAIWDWEASPHCSGLLQKSWPWALAIAFLIPPEPNMTQGKDFYWTWFPSDDFFPSTTGTVVSWKWLKLEVFIELFLQNNYGTLAPSSYSTPPGIIGLCLFDMSPEKLLLAIAYLVLCFLLIDVLCIIFQLYKFCNRLSFRTIQNGICLLYRATSTSYLLKR